MTDSEVLMVNGVAVDPRLLDAIALRRCRLEECQAHCCGGGVSINVTQAEDILAHKDLIFPHLPGDRHDSEAWFVGPLEPEHDHPAGGMTTNTRVIEDSTHPMGTTCVFLRPDRKCALQVAGIAAGEHPWRFKPFYCALHPLTFGDNVLMLDETNEIYIEGGSCNRASEAPPVELFKLFDVETKLALGEQGYAELEARRA